MGKLFLLGAAIAVGYMLGFKDARTHKDHIVARAVQKVGGSFGGGRDANNVDAVMSKVEGKN